METQRNEDVPDALPPGHAAEAVPSGIDTSVWLSYESPLVSLFRP